MMQNLWKKESINGTPLYIDLCKSINPKYCETVINQLQDQSINGASSKNNGKSSEYLQQANQLYQAADFECAMHKYTDALCYAEIGTRNVSMALANRAQCFFQMQKYGRHRWIFV